MSFVHGTTFVSIDKTPNRACLHQPYRTGSARKQPYPAKDRQLRRAMLQMMLMSSSQASVAAAMGALARRADLVHCGASALRSTKGSKLGGQLLAGCNRAQLHCERQELVVKECWSNGKARAHCARRRRGEGAANDCNCRRPGWARISWHLHAGKGLKAP